MDFVERIFHISPDGGNGAAELAIFAALLMAVTVAVRFRVITQIREMLKIHR
jgi:hypothetical protein